MKRGIPFRLFVCILVLSFPFIARGQTAVDYYKWGNMKFDLGDYPAAIQYYTKSIALNSFDAGVYFNRGTARYNQMEYGAAILDFNRVIYLNPKDIKAYILRGFCKYYMEDKAGACADWEHAGTNQCYDACDLIEEYCK